MQSSLYVGLSGQVALNRRLETVANNIANTATAGFRAEEVKFETLLSVASADPVNFSSTGASYLSRRSGEFTKTGNPLDIAVRGDAWLSIQTPAGQVYTRDGRLQMSDTGELRSIVGNPVLDVGGAPIQLDPAAGPPQIAADGMITQAGRQVGAIGLCTIDPRAKLTRAENSGVVPDRPAEPALDFTRTGIVQGFIERSNVNPVAEMTRMIAVTRTFDALTASLSETEQTIKAAIRTLGSANG